MQLNAGDGVELSICQYGYLNDYRCDKTSFFPQTSNERATWQVLLAKKANALSSYKDDIQLGQLNGLGHVIVEDKPVSVFQHKEASHHYTWELTNIKADPTPITESWPVTYW